MVNKRKKIPILLFSLIPLVTFAQDSPPPGVSSLKDRQLGEPHQEQGERIIYDRALPFLAQEVLDLGFKLPNPYGSRRSCDGSAPGHHAIHAMK